jgi:quinol monooxygenase YgiN
MYGTVAKLKLKLGKTEAFKNYMDEENREIPGAVDSYVYQSDEDESILYLVVMFSNMEAYVQYSESAISRSRYEKMLPLLEYEPEWHDGQVIFHRKY